MWFESLCSLNPKVVRHPEIVAAKSAKTFGAVTQSYGDCSRKSFARDSLNFHLFSVTGANGYARPYRR